MSYSVRPHRWPPTRLLCPWDSPGKNTGVGCHFLLQCEISNVPFPSPKWKVKVFIYTHTHSYLEKVKQPSAVLLPGETHGQRSLAGYSPWNHKELDMTEELRLYSYICITELLYSTPETKMTLQINYTQWKQ